VSQRTTEEYLESIGDLEERENPVSTTSIAQVMGVSLASASEMMRRLSEKDLVEYTPYGGASLTEKGRKHFLNLTRRHRLWEVFLNKYLGIGWDEVYQHACNLEHATSDIVADKLAEFLNNPEVCPHGSPIPKKNLKRPASIGINMADLDAGQTARILSVVVERDPEFLRYLNSLNLTLGAMIKVVDKSPYDGTLTIEVNNTTKAVGKEAASLIKVEPLATHQKPDPQSPLQTQLL
jgi:DtxR family Mn-dependent transcriptional regulator